VAIVSRMRYWECNNPGLCFSGLMGFRFNFTMAASIPHMARPALSRRLTQLRRSFIERKQAKAS
jgi:hypothetical protein